MQSLAPFFSGDSLRRYAEECLREHHPSGELPIPIDEIVERDYEIEITPFPDLRGKRGVDGFVSRDCKSIYIDADIMKARNPYRFRFTVAHELAHVVLHTRVFCKATFVDIDGWLGFIDSVSPMDAKYIERQAYKMAGYLLVPKADFEKQYNAKTEELSRRGMDIRTLAPEGIRFIAEAIGRTFEVSWTVIMWQGVYEQYWELEDFPPIN